MLAHNADGLRHMGYQLIRCLARSRPLSDRDYRILVSHNKVPSELQSLFAKQMDRIRLPADLRLWPHPAYCAT